MREVPHQGPHPPWHSLQWPDYTCEQHMRQASTYCHLDSIHGGVADSGEEETKAHASQSWENNQF